MKYLEISGARIAYRETGGGRPVVLLHSSVSSGGQWKSLMAHLGDRFRCYSPDLHGYGASDGWCGDHAMTMADEAEIVRGLMTKTGEPFDLVGHSFGGVVALKVAQMMPGLVANLVLIEPVAFYLLDGPGLSDEKAEIAAITKAVNHAIDAGYTERGMAHFVDYWNGEGSFSVARPELRQELVARAGTLLRNFEAIAQETTLLTDYSTLSMATLVMAAEHSPAPTRRIAKLLAQTIPNANFKKIAAAGHMAPLTHTSPVNQAIADHLQRSAV